MVRRDNWCNHEFFLFLSGILHSMILKWLTCTLWFVCYVVPVSAPSLSKHQMNYVTSHKGPCLTAAFSHDGKLAASGSADVSIKVHFH